MQKQTEKKVIIPKDIKLFLEGILEEADMLILDDNEYEEILSSMYVQLDSFLIGRVLEKLPEDKIEGFVDLDEKHGDNPKKIQEFLEKNLPASKEVFANAFAEFRQMYLENIAREELKLDQEEEDIQNINIKDSNLESIASGKYKAR